jgi:hypothetical protein
MEHHRVNPSGTENVAEVLRELARECNLRETGGTRRFLFVCCDGAPYTSIIRLKNDVNKCKRCIHDHLQQGSCSSAGHEPELISEFDWVVPIIGAGHEERIMLLCYADLAWPVFYQQLSMAMNFQTERAQDVIRRALDHHKAYQTFVVGIFGLAAEIIRPFIQQCDNLSIEATANEFKRYKCNLGPSMQLLIELVFNYGVALLVLRNGVRTEAPDLLLAGRQAFAPLLYLGHHPHYQKIEANDAAMQCRLPVEVREMANQFLSLPKGDLSRSAEATDYVLEMYNRNIKQHFYSGVPTDDQWLIAHRAVAATEGLHECYSKLTGYALFHGNSSRINLDTELAVWRQICRDQIISVISYADHAAGCSGDTHGCLVGFSRMPLDPNCVAYFGLAKRRYAEAVSCNLRKVPCESFNPVDFSAEPAKRISSAQLRRRIHDMRRLHDLVWIFSDDDIDSAGDEELEKMIINLESWIAVQGPSADINSERQ